jgi:DNA/RNA endonuclease G (NUC1)
VAVTDSVKIWCGTFGNHNAYTQSGLQVTVPSHYYKIIQYYDRNVRGEVLLCYWMPNLPTEKKARLSKCVIAYEGLVKNLGLDPMGIFTK